MYEKPVIPVQRDYYILRIFIPCDQWQPESGTYRLSQFRGTSNEVRDSLMIFGMLAKNDEVLGERTFKEQEKFSLSASNNLLTASTVDQKNVFAHLS